MNNLEEQKRFWTEWNLAKGSRPLSAVSLRQKHETLRWLEGLGRTNLDIIEVGCGNGWLTPSLKPLGKVTAIDFSEGVVRDAAQRIPGVEFIAGDFMQTELPQGAFDVAVTLEVLAHVADPRVFLDRLTRLLRPGGYLVLATQNRPVLEKLNRVDPPRGQIRRWVDRHELASLLAENYQLLDLKSVTPRANRGIWRLINSRAVNMPVRALFGEAIERLKERAWLGWTLMAFARKRTDSGGA